MMVLPACSSKEGKLKISDDSLFAEHPNDKELAVSDSVNKVYTKTIGKNKKETLDYILKKYREKSGVTHRRSFWFLW